MMNKLLLVIIFCANLILIGCSTSVIYDGSSIHSVKEVIANPDSFGGQNLSLTGVLILTSEGTYLFEDCSAASKVDLYGSIMLLGKLPEKSASLTGEWVTIKGEFVPRNPKSAYPYSRLTNIKDIEAASGGICINLDFGK
ncbi:hypothetical protein AAKU67_004430 [Oxalobacteraceae bacterium GrIS 2.11]